MEMYVIALCILVISLLVFLVMQVAKHRKDREKASVYLQETDSPPILAIIGDHRTLQPYLKENLGKRFILIENADG